jgi:membrane fusion protein (multidrug efflux system)
MRIPALLLGSIVLLAACGQEPAAPRQMPPPEVSVVTLRPTPVELVREIPGRAVASQVAEVRPQVSGIIKAQLFDEGTLVEAGQPLYQLDDAVYRAELQSAEAALKRAQATLAAARLRAKRSAELARIDAISAQENENAAAALAEAEADVASAQAAVQRRALDVGYATITSPIDGLIGTSTVTPGALVTANQPEPLARVQQLDPIYVDLSASVDELEAFRRETIASGVQGNAEAIPVTIVLPNGEHYPHPGAIRATDLNVDPTTGSFSLRVVVPNPEQAILAGMYLRAIAEVGVREQGILVPQRGITRDPRGNATAMVVQADGSVAVRQVQVDRTIGDQWLVESGLQAGDRVIVAGLQKVRPGMTVNAVEATGAPDAGSGEAAGDSTPPVVSPANSTGPARQTPAEAAPETAATDSPAAGRN